MKKLFYILLLITIPTLLNASALHEGVQVKDIKIVGNERISEQTINFYIKIKSGDYITDDDINSLVKALYKTRLFVDVSAFCDKEENLIIKIQENPLINEVIIGNDEFFFRKLLTNKQLLEYVIKSKPLSIFSETTLHGDLMRLTSAYRDYGKMSAKVKYELKALENNRVNLIFNIVEGKTSKIKSERFVGNKSFPEDKLRRVVKQIFDDTYKPQYLQTKLDLLNYFYTSHGYMHANIQPIVEIDENYQVRTTFLIDEGMQYLLGESKIDIDSKIDMQSLNLEKEVLKFITENKSHIFDAVKVNTVVEKTSKYLNEKGYIFAQVNPEYMQHDEIINVTYRISPGRRIYIDHITVNGNENTLDRVIRSKLSLVEGDIYNASEIQKSQNRLESSGLFSAVKINKYATSDSAINLDLRIKEKKETRMILLTGGMSYTDGLSIRALIKENNLFGSARKLHIELEGDKNSFEANVGITDNNFNDTDTSLSTSLFYEYNNKPGTDVINHSYGFLTKLSYKATDNITNTLKYSYEHKKNNDSVDEDRISTVGCSLTYNDLDNQDSPKHGHLINWKESIAGFGGNTNFIKSQLSFFLIRPILSRIDDNITFYLKIATGNIFPYGERSLSKDQYFFVGEKQIRGFASSGIGPRNKEHALGGKFYFNATQQVDFPLPKLYDVHSIKGSLFIDYATLFSLDYKDARYDDMEKDNRLIRVSMGFGFLIPTPIVGKIRINFGFPLMKESYDKCQIFSIALNF